MAEWLKAHAWKACVLERVPRVRIPVSPPYPSQNQPKNLTCYCSRQRIPTVIMGMLFLFVTAPLSIACYFLDPQPVLGAMFLAVFAAMAMVIVFVYA
jgi:hypothetical protein